jgi:DNA polymerase type B, organellar and viral
MKILKEGMDMQIIERKNTHADRQKRYRERKGENGRVQDRMRKRRTRANTIPDFVGVDSEGIGKGKEHRAVLLGVGEKQYIARNLDIGLQWEEVFEFLYQCFEQEPGKTYVGFYLSYDFNQWLKSFPRDKAFLLLTKKGRAIRKISDGKQRRVNYYPVRLQGWECDMLAFKRLSIRPRVCDCAEQHTKCVHTQMPWMHVCDAGSFYQMGFAKVCEPDRWKDDPEGAICTKLEWNKLFKGKERRAYAELDKEMMEYNVLENLLLARCMQRLARGFASVGIKVGRDQWYGPGSTAAIWLRQQGAPRHDKLSQLVPDWFMDACRKTYYGGWFEIFSHGLILGKSYNYDINNAYPYATAKLSHLCDKCKYTRGRGVYKGNGSHVLLYCTVSAKNTRIGPVPYRDKNGSILRPNKSKGWYWSFELDASNRAGLVKEVIIHEWMEFVGCSHDRPFVAIRDLYQLRLDVGKDSAQGMAIKLNNNSAYGKFAQAVGNAPYNNWFYASYITAHCRTQILDAIASHPRKSNAVLMVATDGICFDSPNPSLPVSKKLGEWSYTEYTDLCLFKPGVYWHREGKEALLKVKSRGVPKTEFAKAIESVEAQFRIMHTTRCIPGSTHVDIRMWDKYKQEPWEFRAQSGWPWFTVSVDFRMKSCRQALNEGNWESAATVQEHVRLRQDSDPQSKRRNPRYNSGKRRIDTYIHDLPRDQLETKYHLDIKWLAIPDIGFGLDGSPRRGMLEAAEIIRDKPANYNLPLNENDYEWETVWNGGSI